MRLLKRKGFRIAFISIVFVIILGSALAASPLNEQNRLFENRLTKLMFRHTVVSLEKISDLLFLPYFFRTTKLETYHLFIPPNNLASMNRALPEDRGFVVLAEKNKVFVSGAFTSGEYGSDIDVRYRGELQNHWIDNKKSFRIDFPSETLYRGMRSLNLVIPDDRQYLVEPLNAYRAKKLGILAPDYYFVRVDLNGVDNGVYLAFEQWSQEWLEKKPLATDSAVLQWENVEGNLDPREILAPEGLPAWNTVWNEEHIATERLQALVGILHEPSDKKFERLVPSVLNMDAFYSWNIVAILARGYHQMTGNNLMFFYNGATGKFEPIINHIERGDEEDILSFDEVGLLSRRTLSIPAFREERDRRLLADGHDKTNLEDDLAYYDTLASVMRPEFLSDSVKTVSNFALLRNLKDDRQYIIDSFNAAPGAIVDNAYNKPDDLIKEGASVLVTKFPDLIASADTSAAFALSHPIAYSAQSALRLLPGEHVMYETLIIPRDTTLFIEAGTTLYFAEGASLISYSPIIARGSPSSPIQFKALDSRKPWGVVAVVDTKNAENVFRYVHAEHGSEATIEGVLFTGMLSLYNAGGTIEHSEFTNAHGDDALNIKGGGIKISDSSFYNNTLDGIDLDFVLPQTSVTKNAFLNNGGDCIDLSWSDLLISDNTIDGCKDKGISVGESSHPTITATAISACDIGIAVKDSSRAVIENTSIAHSRIGLSLYQKKDIFGGGSAQLKNVVFKSNAKDTETDSLSSFEIIGN